MCEIEGIDLSQGIAGHPELILVAIVDEEGNVIPVDGTGQNQEQLPQEETPQQ